MKQEQIATWIVSTCVFCAFGAAFVWSQALPSSAPIAGLEGVGIEQRLKSEIPLDLTFADESGAPVKLEDYFGRRPVVLALVYYECPMLCTEVLNGILRAVRTMTFEVGNEFELVVLSIDPGESSQLAAAKKRFYVSRYDRPGGQRGWHFLTGREESILPLADSVGFHYRYDPQTDLYSHAAAIMVLTPSGRVSHYFFGVEYAPRDLRLALVEASANQIGNPIDQVLLYCYHYDPASGQYSIAIMQVLRLAGVATVLVLGTFMWIMFRRDRRGRRLSEQEPARPLPSQVNRGKGYGL
ncbi:MAG: SCO family protein [Acidobacteriota bacterium]